MIVRLCEGQEFEFKGRNLIVQEETSAPGGDWEAPLHRHFHCDEAWYIVEGTFGFLADGETLNVMAGEFVYVKPGQAHTYWNSGDKEGRYLLFMTENIRDLIQALDKVNQKDLEAVAEVYRRFDGELV